MAYARQNGRAGRGVLLLLLVALLLGGGPSGAAVAGGTPIVPEPEECRVAPRPLDALEAAANAPPVAVASATPELPPNPTGWLEVDPAVADRTAATVREFVACRNAGDAGRTAALLSDDHLRRLSEGIGGLEALLGPLSATPVPVPPERRFALRSVEDYGRTVDGRVGAIVVVDGPAASAPETVGRALYLFVEAGGRYLIDDVIRLDG
jgi:hypothetical protein